MGKNKLDPRIQKLFDTVKAKRAEIASIDKPNYKTNQSFSFDYQGVNSAQRINLNTVTDVNVLVSILAFIIEKDHNYRMACNELNLGKIELKWMGYTYDEWLNDIQIRVAKVSVNNKKAELADYEKRLFDIAPELKKELELEALTKALS